jgi:hypothetical protein
MLIFPIAYPVHSVALTQLQPWSYTDIQQREKLGRVRDSIFWIEEILGTNKAGCKFRLAFPIKG